MSVARVWEAPRVTKPYTEAQWDAIERLGHRIDREFEQGDVRLTMGGEPTFVSLDDPDGAEWNTAALGPTKRRLAAQLYHRLRDHYAPHGLVHFGQGKWYPGEQLPRWSLNCVWRRDGQPIWHEPSLIADETRDYGVTPASAQRFLQSLAERLGLDPRQVFPGFEDVFYYLWRERRLPINVDPLDSRVDDAQERARLMRVFSQGLDRISGHVLPIARNAAGTHWQSGAWFLREQRCYLIPGDSPMGYRLPLDSQPWVTRSEYPYVQAPDPTQSFPPLATYTPVRAQPRPGESSVPLAARAPRAHESASAITRTAMCAEPRDGVLYLFMPPTERAEDYLQLVAAIEATAAALDQPVLLEGYAPPRDPRLNHFSITPDPGVIEVNTHPAHDWSELVERTTFLYQAARAVRLGTEKFMLDGRHTGTGGGNHFVLGGATPLDSPFLRRPDLLAQSAGLLA